VGYHSPIINEEIIKEDVFQEHITYGNPDGEDKIYQPL